MESIKNCRWIVERKSISEEKQTKKKKTFFKKLVLEEEEKLFLLNQSIHPARNWTKQTHTHPRDYYVTEEAEQSETGEK
jgi:hypothetical protein